MNILQKRQDPGLITFVLGLEVRSFGRAKHSGRQFISDNQRFTAGMLRPYEYIYKNEIQR